MTSKRENKKKIEELKEILAATHRKSRDEEIEDHGGKPFTHRNLPTPKTKYNRRKEKNVRDDY